MNLREVRRSRPVCEFIPGPNVHSRRSATCDDKMTKRSDRSDGQPDRYRRTPVPVVSADGGGAVMAAVYVDDGVTDGPDASFRVVYITTDGLRDANRYETTV